MRAIESCLDAVYPRRCGTCARLGPAPLCAECVEEFRPAGDIPAHAPLEAVFALWSFEGRAAQAVRRLKYQRATCLADPMAEMLRHAWGRIPLADPDLVIPVPIHWTRRCLRGFNQSERLVAGFPIGEVRLDALRRIRRTRPQVGLDAKARRLNLRGAFAASPVVNGRSVLLVDDVVTTGGTAVACADALLRAGATRVCLLAFCGESG